MMPKKQEVGVKKERLEEIKAQKAEAKKQVAGKTWSNLSAKEKDALLETVCKMLGIIE